MTLAIARIARASWWRRLRAWLRPRIDQARAREHGGRLAWADAIERHLAWTAREGAACDGYQRPAPTAMTGPGERCSR